MPLRSLGRWLRIVLVITGALLVLSACTTPSASPATPTAEPTATATITPSPSPVPPTPTATATPLPPTATATPRPATPTPPPAAPAATPTVDPAATPTPEPPARFVPSQVGQGETAALLVRAAPGDTVTGMLDGRPLLFTTSAEGAWALAGIPRTVAPGPRTAHVRLQDAAGRVTDLNAVLTVTASNFPIENIDLPPGQGSLLDPAIVNQEFALVTGLWRASPPERRWEDGPFLRPAEGPISSIYGIRRSYNGGPPSGSHEGLDIAANAGDPVRAAAAGTVVAARELRVRGNAVLVDHGMGLVTGYYHLSELAVQEGQTVARGELLGKVGETGLATGPHLHWDVIVGGINVNPVTWTQRALP